ncbi:helix-turn-helix transcriptional regulator [Bacillus sp. AFS041924]|uniref:helix-turn-helix transcriptional regulator n=1 Tax=Bacillus sp. AFS041924 TaxID=2033503 RepID=UPI00159BA9D6|nr:helix-turn-helix transcriptional regulator [Bacillus sp. AFS041924]
MKNNLDELINKSGLKKGFLASKLDVTPQQFSKWLKGEHYPPANKLFKLAYILNCKVDELYTYEEE